MNDLSDLSSYIRIPVQTGSSPRPPPERRRITLFDASSKRVSEVLGQIGKEQDNNIESLSVDGCKLKEGQLEKIIEICALYPLERLFLRGNGIDQKGVKLLASLLSDPRCCLKELDLRWNCVDNSGAESIATALHLNKKLEKIYLSKNNIGNEGAIAIASALEHANTTLEFIDLEENKIGVSGVCGFASALVQNSCLRTLRLEGNKQETSPSSDEYMIAAIADALTSNITLTKITLPKPSVPLPSHPNLSYWYSMTELHVRRNVLLQMRRDLVPLNESISNQNSQNSKNPDIDLSKIRDTLQKSERLLFSQIIQLQNEIQTSDIAGVRKNLDLYVEEKNRSRKTKNHFRKKVCLKKNWI